MRISTLLIGIIFLLSCNQNTNTGDSGTFTEEDALSFPLNMQKGGEYKSLDQIRVQARTIIDHRVSQEEKALAMLTYGYWWPEFVFNGSTMSSQDQYAGYWLKFNDDFTYNYGLYTKTLGKGKYHFRLDDNSLYMLDDQVAVEPKVWTANHNGEVIALVGSHEYGINNGMQIKMVGLEQKPVK